MGVILQGAALPFAFTIFEAAAVRASREEAAIPATSQAALWLVSRPRALERVNCDVKRALCEDSPAGGPLPQATSGDLFVGVDECPLVALRAEIAGSKRTGGHIGGKLAVGTAKLPIGDCYGVPSERFDV